MVNNEQGQLTQTVGAGWNIREAKPSDRSAVERVWSAEFDDPHEEVHQHALDEYFDPDHNLYEFSHALVATDARGRVVGFGLVELRNTSHMARHTTLDESEFSGRDGYLYLGAVESAWQGKGIGSKLFAQRCRWCVEQNANAIYGVAWQNPKGRSSDFLFKRLQFREIANTPDDYYQGRDCPVCENTCDCGGIIYRREL